MSTMQLSSSMTIMPPEPIIEPAAMRVVIVHGGIEHVRRQAAAGGAAGLHGFERLAAGGMPPPIS